MTVQCIDCSHSMRPKGDSPSDLHMVRAGFAVCDIKPAEAGNWLAVLYPRHCGKFSPSPDAEKRRAWMVRQ